jgi:uncharacterized cupin superfamily protein
VASSRRSSVRASCKTSSKGREYGRSPARHLALLSRELIVIIRAIANCFRPDFDADQERPGFTYRRAKLGWQSGAEKLGVSLYEIPPGEATFPYHAHAANEEILIVLAGRPSLRTPSGWRELPPGEVIAFPVGEEGAHQIVNRADEPVRALVGEHDDCPRGEPLSR